ncbi:MAG: D-alanine--D-alanine ligase [bacterium]
MEELRSKRVGVLAGGWSREREISLLSGRMVYDAFKRKGLDAVMIDVRKNSLDDLIESRIDVAFIALHGEGGEDGQIQAVLEVLGVPYSGSGVLACALSLNKAYSKMIFEVKSIRTPEYCLISRDGDPRVVEEEVLQRIGIPMVLKPTAEGSSIGVKFVRSGQALTENLSRLQEEFGDLIAERLKEGMCATVGILGCGRETKALPVLELVPKREFYDYTAKYTEGMTEFVIPARLERSVYEETQELALRSHRALGCHGFSRVDMVIENNKVPFVLEVNSIPGMMKLSDLPAEAKHDGIDYDDLVIEILKSAYAERPV